MNKALVRIGEMISAPFSWISISGIRSTFRVVGTQFWPKSHPRDEGTIVNYDYTRTLYRNAGDNGLGGGFAKPIVDLQVGFIGIPRVTVNDENLDTYLNDCISIYWTSEIQDFIRDSIRDSKIIVRVSRPDVLDPLMTLEEAQHCTLECIPPERVSIERNFRNRRIIERAIIIHRMTVITSEGDPTMGVEPTEEEHDVLEIIDRDRYRFFDQNTSSWMPDMETPNTANVVPLVEIYNEWDAALQGGQSDLESVIPFIQAFHDVVAQGLQAHSYHSTPKVKLKLTDVAPFIKNNFPEAWDDQTGTVKPNAEVSWRGREIIFLQAEDDMDFLEAVSVLGDTKTLAEFLIDCICIASQTPEWAFMRVDSGSANSDRNAQTVPFVKKIGKKRRNFQKAIQDICKIALVMYGEIPLRAKVDWEVVRADDQVVTMQAFQQLMMGLEVARQRGEISDKTYQDAMRQFLPQMGPGAQERSTPDQPALPAGPVQEPAIRSNA
jgi:hypothetical protein